MTDIWATFARSWNDSAPGFGRHSYAAARAAGYSNQEISDSIQGRRLGRRAQDMINAGIQAERAQGDLKAQLESYKSQVGQLQQQYNQQLVATQSAQASANEFQSKFDKASADYEAARQEADSYKEEAVGQQLRALRAGTVADSGGVGGGGIGDLTGGKARFSSGDSGSKLSQQAREEAGLTDSVLNRKGPVVERISSGNQRQAGPSSQPNRGLAQGAGTGSYYASRFA